ncbi:hypothetical protein CDAR_613731 [Caerostris darwini]|uniref:Uncharacterized protein n=1 Tax=Caerostris darwini TaxID=1538125 RepID=A0AAV4THU0_9ARAC|nr:hypothetical protein CDAR_613731 [Caerostris darwini]
MKKLTTTVMRCCSGASSSLLMAPSGGDEVLSEKTPPREGTFLDWWSCKKRKALAHPYASRVNTPRPHTDTCLLREALFCFGCLYSKRLAAARGVRMHFQSGPQDHLSWPPCRNASYNCLNVNNVINGLTRWKEFVDRYHQPMSSIRSM